MKVILAEKPSVARDIAAVVGAKTKRDGYFEGNDYAVTYAFGHLVTLAEPEDMNPAWGSPWRIEQLPMVPKEWKYRIVDKSASQFNVIKKLFIDPSATSIICATDAGREGEHIFRLIYKLSGSQKPVERLWISSLTADAIKDGLKKLKPSKEFDNLASAAAARAHADWVVGLNFTRAYTSINSQLCTIGRVQTPTLALIVEKQIAIDNFQSTPFYEILATFAPGFIARYLAPQEGEGERQTRVKDKALAQGIVKDITPLKHGKVESLVTSEKRAKAPALYDLLTLQKDANKRFGYTAQETLNLAQSLYEEHKLISYPRTESRHLSTDMVDELPRILSQMLKQVKSKKVLDAFAAQSIVPGSITTSLLKPKLSKAYVDDTKLTDHHAIIPTFNAPTANLPDKQKNVYDLVVTRFLSIFLPPEIRDETVCMIALGEHTFRAKGVIIKDVGWTVLEDNKQEKGEKPEKGEKKKKEKDGEEEQQTLPALTAGDEIEKLKQELKERKTSAPKPYDDASLLTAMKNAGQEIDDEDLASYMKQKGLGTPATRAAIIERLLQTGYVERNKKYFAPTTKGRALIEQVHSDLKDVALTANWEQRLADMQDGKMAIESFEGAIADFVVRILPDVTKAGPALAVRTGGALGICPQCKKGAVRKTAKGAGCNRWKETEPCNFSIWKEQRGKELTDEQMQEILENGRTKLIKGFKKKDGSGTYDARLVLTEEFKLQFELGSAGSASGNGAPNGGSTENNFDFGKCPQCKKGNIRLNSKAAGCSRWREEDKCTFTVWKTQYGKTLTNEEIKGLIDTGRTPLLKGFQKKSGNGTYDAILVVGQDYKVKLEFPNSGPEPNIKPEPNSKPEPKSKPEPDSKPEAN